jgi:glycosyltransferase involved in cell wall biosynthesis
VSPVELLAVVIPARDEERLLGPCLDAVLAAVDHLGDGPPARPSRVAVEVVVALDSCTDRSADVAGRFPVRIVHLDTGSVGAARRAAAGVALDAAGRRGSRPEVTWLACTDADTVVPSDWLARHLVAADAGADVLLGTVEPDASCDPGLGRAWHRLHHLGEGHPYVHGANLGVRGSAYLAVGGFGDDTAHEDVELVGRLRAAGFRCLASDRARVRTSARTDGRVPRGFSTYLATLAPHLVAAGPTDG